AGERRTAAGGGPGRPVLRRDPGYGRAALGHLQPRGAPGAMIETERLILAPWTEAERAPYAAMCADPEVMHDYGGPWDEARTQERFARHVAAFAADGFCKWSIRRKADRAWIGYCGLSPVFPDLPVSPGLEIGWRMARDAWGHGYATEAARAAIGDIFQRA